MIFENLENPDNKDQKLSFIEKGIILAAIGAAKVVLWKVGKAKTYGDLQKIGNFIEDKIDDLDQDQELETITNENDAFNKISKVIKNITTGLTSL